VTNMRKIKKKNNLIINLAVAVAAIALTLLFLEIFFRIYLGNNLHYDYVDDLWVLKPDQNGFTYPNNKHATINSEGYRGDLIDPKKETVLFLGDSLLFGYTIGDNDTLTQNLLRELQKKNISNYNIVNGGVPGYSISQMLELYNYTYSKYRPKYVVVSFIEWDIFRKSEEQDPSYFKKMIARKLIRSSSFIAHMKPRLEILRQLIIGPEQFRQENYDVFLSEDMNMLNEFDKMLKRSNTTLILHVWTYQKNQSVFYSKVYNISSEYNLSLLPDYYHYVFEEYPNKIGDLYSEDGHPSEIQTKRLAEVMINDLLAYVKK